MTVPSCGMRAAASFFFPPDCKVHVVIQVLGRHLCTIYLRSQAYNQPESSEAFVNTHCWWRSQCPKTYDIPYIMMTMLVLCQFWICSARQVAFMGQHSLRIWLYPKCSATQIGRAMVALTSLTQHCYCSLSRFLVNSRGVCLHGGIVLYPSYKQATVYGSDVHKLCMVLSGLRGNFWYLT